MDKEELFILLLKNSLDENKIKILELSSDNEVWTGLILSKKMKLSPPLIAYHLNGNNQSRLGMVEMGMLARVHDKKGIVIGLKITDFGREILKVVK